jgi:TPR repeat protein
MSFLVNCADAVRKLNRAADQNNYGACLLNGIGGPINKSEATTYFKLAPDLDDKRGQYQ